MLIIIICFLVEYRSVDMEYMTIKEVSEKWGLSVRRIQTICNENMIHGVIKFDRE